MRQPVILLFPVFSIFFLFTLLLGDCGSAEVIRKPVWAGSFYPADQEKLEKTIEQLTGKTRQVEFQIPTDKALKALILPHAGYIYSGATAAYSSLVLTENQFAKIVLLGPDHRVGFANAAISDVDAYETPLGLIRLHSDAEQLRKKSDLFRAIPASDQAEHSLEVVLPFLQYYLKSFELIPIVIGHGEPDTLADAVRPVLTSNTLLVASSDLSHFLSYSEAITRDHETIKSILNLQSDMLKKNDNRACGAMPILIIMDIAFRLGWRPVLLHYSNSGDTAGKRSSVVGYAAIAFYGDKSMQKTEQSGQQFSRQEGQILARLARFTIMERLGKKIAPADSAALNTALQDKNFTIPCATFVTLHSKNGQLRGCMGCLTAMESVLEGVKRNALNAAFHDPRFTPVKQGEIDNIDIEISILSEPKPFLYSNTHDLLTKLRPHVDGVIIRLESASATFLPQVWEQLPLPENFLSRLCQKAGLPLDIWQKKKLEVKTYQVQHFQESKI